MTQQPILFYDGHCGLCSRLVRFIAKRDGGLFLFAPLQGQTAVDKLQGKQAQLNTVFIATANQLRSQSSAIVFALRQLSLPWRLLGSLLWCVPVPIRNLGYGLVAKIRHRVFGTHTQCWLDSSLKGRFLE